MLKDTFEDLKDTYVKNEKEEKKEQKIKKRK